MDQPGFCDPTNFSQYTSTAVGSTDEYEYALHGPPQGLPYHNSTEHFQGGNGGTGDPWWTSNKPYDRHAGWEENTKFYELQSYRQGSAMKAPMPPKLREAEQQRLAQLNIPRSFPDFYPTGVYTRKYGYGDYIDQPPGTLVTRPYPDKLAITAPEDQAEHFTNGQAPWYASEDPWYANNYADDIDYGNYDSKRYEPIYRAASEARTQELGALYNNGSLHSPGIETFAERLVTGSPYTEQDKKKRTLVF